MSAPSQELRARVLAQLQETPAPTRREHLVATARIAVAGLAASLLLFAAIGGVKTGDRPVPYVAASGLALGALAAALYAAVVGRARSPLGPPAGRLLAVALGAPLALTVFAIVGRVLWPATEGCDGPGNHDGRCFFFAVVFAIPPLAAFFWSRRGQIVDHVVLHGAAFGAVTGTFGALLITLRCTYANLSHLLLGHVVPVVAVAVAGSLLGARALRLRPLR